MCVVAVLCNIVTGSGYGRIACIDGHTKLNHFRRCGHSRIDQQPHLSTFFNEPDAIVAQRMTESRLNLPACMAPLADVVGMSSGSLEHDCSDDEAVAKCSASLSCSRPSSKPAKGVTDVHGVVGAVCAHTVPVRSGFMDMRTPEQFAYYLILLTWLLPRVPELRDVYIDFGCRLAITWARYAQAHPEISDADRLRIMVNWMHARGHEEACEVVNSARHHVDAARRVGENAEQLWSMLKVWYLN